MTAPPASALPVLHVACLCAAWCRTCDAYEAVFEAEMAALREQQPALQAHWIDIEGEAELLGDVDIETFPTLLVVDADRVLFAGTLTPQPETLRRVLRAALQTDAHTPQTTPEFAALAQRLRLRWPANTA